MLSRRGLHRLRYHALHVRRAHLLTMRATTELSDQHALELIGGMQMSSGEEPLPGCFQPADIASWLTNKSAASGKYRDASFKKSEQHKVKYKLPSEKYQAACGVLSGKSQSHPLGGESVNVSCRCEV